MIILFEYKTVSKAESAEITEKKSRFISHVLPVSDENEAIEFISSLKSKYWDAAHNVYAYVLKDNNIQRYSDDGEPSGTAGMPTLDAIRKEGLVDVCIVTTRYFGGTLLGTGGLVRAYAKSAKCGIDAAGTKKRIMCFEYGISAEYSLMGKIQNAAAELNCIAGDVLYTENVFLKYYVPYDIQDFTEKITDAANGRVIITKDCEGRYIDVK